MPYFAVTNANTKYVGIAYSGAFMEEIGRKGETASYPSMSEAIDIAVELKSSSGDQTDWNVVNEFSERVVYTTKQPDLET